MLLTTPRATFTLTFTSHGGGWQQPTHGLGRLFHTEVAEAAAFFQSAQVNVYIYSPITIEPTEATGLGLPNVPRRRWVAQPLRTIADVILSVVPVSL